MAIDPAWPEALMKTADPVDETITCLELPGACRVVGYRLSPVLTL
jgi:hypothetical protein